MSKSACRPFIDFFPTPVHASDEHTICHPSCAKTEVKNPHQKHHVILHLYIPTGQEVIRPMLKHASSHETHFPHLRGYVMDMALLPMHVSWVTNR